MFTHFFVLENCVNGKKITNGDFIPHYEPNNDAVAILDIATNQKSITFLFKSLILILV